MKRLQESSKTSHPLKGAFLAMVLSLIGVHASAATVACITAGDTAGLQAALAAAESNNDDDVIELQAGEYSMPINLPLSYSATNETHNLTIEGGYGDSMGNPCGASPATPDARQTVLNGGTLYVHMAGAGSFAMRSVTVQNTFSTDPTFPPVYIGGYIDFTGTVTIQHAMFLGNASTAKSAVYIFAAMGSLTVQDSLFATNETASATESPVHLGSLSTAGGVCAVITSSTFAGNSSGVAAGLDVYASMCIAVAANDIFWGSPLDAVRFEYPAWTYLANDDLDDLAEAANAAQATGVVSLDPMFYPDFSLHDLSPLRDMGTPGGFIFNLEPYDVAGNPRVYGDNPDIGAFETHDIIFADGFEL